MSNFSTNDISNKEELKKLAQESLELSKFEDLKDCIYYYTIARYLVAVFEANSFKIPVQVWNEYRNSLDHLMRAVVAQDKAIVTKQLHSSRGHLLRACLDVTKLLCTRSDDWFQGLKSSKAYFTYALVDNGNFLGSLENQYTEAKKLMISAKTHDIHLGSDPTKDDAVVDLYLDAYFAYKELETMFHDRQGASVVSSISYYLLYLKANWTTMLFSGTGKIIAAILIFFIGKYSDNFIIALSAAWQAF